jgi:methylenetetrahydrofolate dehydrogenase (NADP+)/methenyltetrahydrofolate cyclohydrolase
VSAALLDGKKLAQAIAASLAPRVAAVKAARGAPPTLAIVAAQSEERDAVSYRKAQQKACESAGLGCVVLARPWTSAAEVLAALHEERGADAVIIDRPLPPAVDLEDLYDALPPSRDAEGAAPASLGKLFALKHYDDLRAQRLPAPCTALAIAELLRSTHAPLAGKTAVVLGRSNIVGKPAAHLLSCLDLTVTLCHSRTRELPRLVEQADVVVAALGRAGAVKASWIKPGAIVIDAGINADGGKLVGDVEPAAAERAGHYTPVPGGVGPVTTAMLLANTVALAERSLERKGQR